MMISATWTNNVQRMCVSYLHNVAAPYEVLVGEEFLCRHDMVIAINDCLLRFAILEDALRWRKLSTEWCRSRERSHARSPHYNSPYRSHDDS